MFGKALACLLITTAIVSSTTTGPTCIPGDYIGSSEGGDFSTSATNVDNLTVEMNVSVANRCVQSQALRFRFQINSGSEDGFGSIQVFPDRCDPTVTGTPSTYYESVEMSCVVAPNTLANSITYQVTMTFRNPTSKLNGTNVNAQESSETGPSFGSTKTIILQTCPNQLNESGVVIKSPNDFEGNHTFGVQVEYSCSKPHGVIFTTLPGQNEQIQQQPGSVTCGSRATWEFENPTRCWNGRTVYFDKRKPSDHHVVHVVTHPVLFVCRNTNRSQISRVEIKLGGVSQSQDPNVVWQNVTARELKALSDVVPITCVQHFKQGKTEEKTVQIIHKRIHVLHTKVPLRYAVSLNSRALIKIPVYSHKPLNKKHVHIKKQGDHKAFHNFHIGRTSRNDTRHVIEFDFKNVTKEDVGTYEVRIATSPIDVFEYKFELYDNSGAVGLSAGAKAGVALTVVISFMIIAAALGYIARKFINHKKELDSDGQRVLIIEDNDDNDDVFHNPQRAARLQEELIRDSEEASTSGTAAREDEPTPAQLAPAQNNADKTSLASEHSECFILDENNAAADETAEA